MVAPAASFGDLLKKHRVAVGVYAGILAGLARVSANAISSLERGARRAPHRETVSLLASALNLSEDDRREFEDAAETVRARVPQGHDAPAPRLPAQLTSFVGREYELTQILELFDRASLGHSYGCRWHRQDARCARSRRACSAIAIRTARGLSISRR